MSAYYNEIDPNAAAWLRNLIAAGHIAPGDVDERSIEDVRPDDLRPYRQCHFFAGIGVWSYALRCAGWPDDRRVWTGSCPCQPFSAAGEGAGFDDQRHLWPAWFQLIAQCLPDRLYGEQVASADGLAWLDLVLADLEGADYACGAFDLCAAGIGAPHIRQRLWIVGDAERPRLEGHPGYVNATGGVRPESAGSTTAAGGASHWSAADWLEFRDGKRRPIEPGTFPMAYGAPTRVVRVRAYGNAIVAPLATEVIRATL
jgi:DNA (cytosine-5)-methyltransferase 1